MKKLSALLPKVFIGVGFLLLAYSAYLNNFYVNNLPNLPQPSIGRIYPLRYTDSTGLDVWLEEPSGGEPSFHQSVNVVDPNGEYNSYSFGTNGNGIQGEVYRDNDLGGPIEAYKKTSPQQDSAYQKWLDSQVGKTGTYDYDNICRSWSQRQYKRAPRVSANPPIRVQVPQLNITPSSSRSTAGTSSTTGTGTSR